MFINAGFAMSYGVFQEYYSANWTLQGNREVTGIIGTTTNGVMYLSMPFLFALFTKRWARKRRIAALCGAALTCLSFLLSSFSTQVWHLVATQGVMAALGCALIYSPTTLSLGEWFSTSNRAVAYGVVLSCKNIVGSTCPFLFRVLLDRYGFRIALRLWTATAGGTSILAVLLIPTHPLSISSSIHRSPKIPWHFLKHQTFYIYSIAIILQSSGYGIPQTYLNTYAHEATLLSQTSATLLLTLFNVPGIVASSFFGYLSDNKRFSLSATTVSAISAVSSALSAFLLWGLTSRGSMALLVLFSMTFGFFAGGYSATWGGVINELEREAAQRNEAIDTGMLYGLLNGARGIGYVTGGLAGVPLLKAGSTTSVGSFGYGTTYGPLIIFTGLSSVFGGWGLLWKWKLLRLV
ncbi:MFS general substrate transporter [Glonium stellatum]|uniref:MFS general substrate transporter n=1 Tax=Glonium stellatum TaxID=574774 RepID=A0A8E2FDQ9_9PEZI|nr:MFS general substrate transporter [Glonium stellatum]